MSNESPTTVSAYALVYAEENQNHTLGLAIRAACDEADKHGRIVHRVTADYGDPDEMFDGAIGAWTVHADTEESAA